MEEPSHLHPPQDVLIEAAAVDDPDSTIEYFIDAEEFTEVAANAVVLVDAVTQYSRPSAVAASPNPLVCVRVTGLFEAVITAQGITRVYEAPRRPLPPPPTPPPPPLYANTAP